MTLLRWGIYLSIFFTVTGSACLVHAGSSILYGGFFEENNGNVDFILRGRNFRVGSFNHIQLGNQYIQPTTISDAVLKAEAPFCLSPGSHNFRVFVGGSYSNQVSISLSDDLYRLFGNCSIYDSIEPGELESLSDSDQVVEIESDVSFDESSVLESDSTPTSLEDDVRTSTLVVDDTVSLPFADIDVVPWLSQYLPHLYSQGIISGYDDGTFRPLKSVSRIEALKMMSEALEVPVVTGPTEDWRQPYIDMALAFGIMQQDGDFNPDQPISRFEVVEALLALDRMYTGSVYTSGEFTYADLDAVSNLIISSLVVMEVISQNAYFYPERSLSRAEWSKILSLYLERRTFGAFLESRIIR